MKIHHMLKLALNVLTLPVSTLALAVPVTLHAAPPLPATSTVELKMTRTVEIVKEPTKEEELAEHAAGAGHVCFGNRAHYSLEPVFRRGSDAKSSTLILSIYIITKDTKRKYAILKPISQIIPRDPNTPLVTDTSYHHLIQWRCKCRSRGDTMKMEPEWYIEVIQDGKVLCSNQSKQNTTIRKLIESRIPISEMEAKALPDPQALKLEGENLKNVIGSGGAVQQQSMRPFGGQWSGNQQLWWTSAKPGDSLKIALSVPKSGKYRVKAQFTKAADYGIFELQLNGRKIKESIDFHNTRVDVTGVVDFGLHNLQTGDNEFKAVITGANPQAIKHYMFGLDYIELIPQE